MTEHDLFVKYIVTDLEYDGFTDIHADITGYPQPTAITWIATDEGFIPDISAVAPNGEKHIFEIEMTEEDLDTIHTKKQLITFGTHATEYPNIKAWLVVPRRLEAKAASVAKKINFLILSITRPTPQLNWG